jgi:hypothetical protein
MLAALLPLVAAHATLIAVKSSDAQCPSSQQIGEAIEARLPGVLVPPEQSALPEALLLTTSLDPATGAQSFSLVDRQQQVKLRRELPLPTSSGPQECPALAETVALMVERYLQDLGYHPEPPPPPPPERRRWDLFGGATWRPGTGGLAAYELRMGVGRVLGARGRAGLTLAVGVEGASQQEWRGASGRLRRYPAELRLAWRTAIGKTSLELGPFAGLQLLVLNSHSQDDAATDLRLVPTAGLGAGLRIPLGRAPFVRVVAALGVALLRYDFVNPPPDRTVAFGTERVWGKMGLEAGFSFW